MNSFKLIGTKSSETLSKCSKKKKDFTTFSRGKKNWRETKKAGSLIGDIEDAERRKQVFTAEKA